MTPQQKYYLKNKERLLKESRERYARNLESERARSQKYREDNLDVIKKRRAQKAKQQRLNDPAFRIKSNISRRIREILKQNNSSKKGKTILNYLGYSIHELKKHLESQFEPWMTWNNYGQYRKLYWDDHNINTWTWQIDHIIPQSKLQYISMDDENFQICWSLKNLRPLSAKQNFLEGIKLPKSRKL